MPFEKGKSGNPAGRPKRDPLAPTDYSIREAIKRVVKSRPDLLEDAIERLLRGSRSTLGMLELAAKLNQELATEEQGNRIAIVFTGTLNPNTLKQVDAKVIECPAEMKRTQALEPGSNETQGNTLSTNAEIVSSLGVKSLQPMVLSVPAAKNLESSFSD